MNCGNGASGSGGAELYNLFVFPFNPYSGSVQTYSIAM